ncbi:hypothetical protein TSH7_01325 [Azospirillum sp. TSH7]|uniref:hypothetical protein n=1 Tax=unclassified Azospirillum TaxID=2630922 RepID=UPI000D622E84|nr:MULTISPECIES: hypothetical protein [unclassified Azospirillum]PWC69113.1 hypothetical protein TSH7_01325 [Azospirillum sp. TSH7]PWC71395.1 hypothetical protein TSH20_03750 [Azospirillum sp. TSH20]
MLKLTPYPRASSGSKSTAARIGDTLSLAGATELAERIQAHWHGHPVGVRVEPIQKVDGACIGYCVRSNLVNGLPPR